MEEASKQAGPGVGGHVLDWLPLLVCHVEADGRISYLNRRWEQFSGVKMAAEPIMWSALLDRACGIACRSARCLTPKDYCVHKNVALRHHDGVPVTTDLHWQKMGGSESGGWILFCHPEAVSTPLLPDVTGLLSKETVQAAASSVLGCETTADLAAVLPLRPELLRDALRVEGAVTAVNGQTQDAATANRKPEAGKKGFNAQSASYSAQRAFRALGREMASRNKTPDRLTGLQQRADFEARLSEAVTQAQKEGKSLGVLLIDVDYLGDLNELFGRECGDQVLKLVAGRLRAVAAHENNIARSGDDEFSAFVTGDVDSASLAEYAQALLNSIDVPFRHGSKQIRFGVSIGATIYPRDTDRLPCLRNAAQLALNDVKAQGRGGFRLFEPGMAKRADGVTAQTNSVRQMLDQDLIYPAYQAKVRLLDGRITGAEALMRWHRPGEKACGPESFPEIFRNYDLATRVSARVQERVFKDIALWRRAGLMPPHISINAAPVEFMQDDYAEKLLARLDHFGLSARQIELELTEHVLYQNSEHYMHRALTLLRRAGVRLTLDDFGTGYSSLGFLRDYPVSSIKIDRSFIRKICIDPSMEVIVGAIIRFGETVSVDVVAEGIETQEQLMLLQKIGCPTGQGFLFSPPVVATSFAHLLAGSRQFPV
ncbi:putative bifunctional diguanylate cyclase/phosphodiesterase [Asaia astilbis]